MALGPNDFVSSDKGRSHWSPSDTPRLAPPPAIPFHRPLINAHHLSLLRATLDRGELGGAGETTATCQKLLQQRLLASQVLLTQSCTAALEMAALLLEVKAGDEVIMPSFTFVSTANAFVLRGATPVFVDIRPDTLNLDESEIERAISPRTKAIVAMHYAGVGCELNIIGALARNHGLALVEDAAQAIDAHYCDKALGTFGDLGTLSFHHTKNITSGEGGALIVNNPRFAERADVLWEKGTNRSAFKRNLVDRYSWIDLGGSHAPSELTASLLLSQLEEADYIKARKLEIWACYHEALSELEMRGFINRPKIPRECQHNAHFYWFLARDHAERETLIDHLAAANIAASSHYVPLHSAPAGRRFGKPCGPLAVTNSAAERIVRLPSYVGLEPADQARVVAAIQHFYLGSACP